MNKRKLFLIIVLICMSVIVGLFLFINPKKQSKKENSVNVNAAGKNIDSEKYNIISGNIYYLYDENEDSSLDKEYESVVSTLSNYLKENYPNISVLVNWIDKQKAAALTMDQIIENEQYVEYTNDTVKEEKYDFYFDVYQIQDGIVLINKKYTIIVDSSNSVTIDGIAENPFREEVIDQSRFIKLSDALKIVIQEMNNNVDSLYVQSADEIHGTERLEYDGDKVYYLYIINDSHLKIDAQSGEIIEESFMNKNYSIQ